MIPVIKESRGEVLNDLAFSILMDNLNQYGNSPSREHQEALLQALGLYSKLALGESTGRFAVPLGTGLGKTQSIIAFIVAVYRLELDISLSVSASHVEALCDLKRELMKNGVPDEMIGLFHSYDYDQAMAERYLRGEKHGLDKGYASLPATQDHDTKPFLLITHNRVRDAGSIKSYNTYRGRPRDLMIWDESLFLSNCMSIELWRLKRATKWLEATPGLSKDIVSYLWQCVSLFDEELEEQRASNRDPEVITVPPLTNQEFNIFMGQLPHGEETDVIKAFLDMSQYPLRIYKSKESGLISYDLVIDSSLQNIVVLDASFSIRKLLHLNKDIKLIGDNYHRLVSYENVTVYQMPFHSGRNSFDNYLKEYKDSDAGVFREIIEVIRCTPPDQAVLVFTFKARDKSKDFVWCLRRALKKAGVDLNGLIEVDVYRDGQWVKEPRRRINFLTWGNETSLNRYSYCSIVVFAGVLHRSRLELASQVVGQLNDIDAPIDPNLLKEIEESEICQCLYQAMSRGSCRVIEGYKTKPMTVYLIHKYRTIRTVLGQVMPGLKWEDWVPKFMVSKSRVNSLTKQIVTYLEEQKPEVKAISTRKIKSDLGLSDVPRNTFTRIIKEVDRQSEWFLVKKSMVRACQLFS